MYGTTAFTERGDLTIAWDEPDDPDILAMLDQKMSEGFVFFLIEPRLGGTAAPIKTRLLRAQDALKQRVVVMASGDKTIAGLIESGKAQPVPTPKTEAKVRRKAKTAKEAASGETVAVRPKKGG